ncbi:MAG: DNA polymerase I [Oligoflexia bacterium]|nr:DNA polymerase I [Oligoflexia bacterium]
MKKLYLIDVSSLFFRAYYAIRQLNNSKGVPTNALYGFLAAIAKILKEHKPDGIAFCLDRPESGFREEIYPEYKANRDEAPADLIKQFPYIHKLADALSIPAFEKAGFEADDIIGTLTKKSMGKGIEVTIVSGDKDFSQLIEPGVRLFDPSKDAFLDSAGVRAKMGVDPNQVIDYLALIGDASDNVPGVKGIGPKGAQKLLNEYKTLDGIFEHVDEIKNDRIREMLKTQKKEAYLSQKLCTIHCETELNRDPNDLKIKSVNRDLLIPLLEELEFKALLSKLLGENAETLISAKNTSAPKPDVKDTLDDLPLGKVVRPASNVIVTSKVKELDEYLKKENAKEVWLDVTTRGTALQWGGNVFRFEGATEDIKNWLDEHLRAKSFKLSGFDIKSAAHQLRLTQTYFTHINHDVLLQAYCVGEGGPFEFQDLLKKYLKLDLPEFALPEERLDYAQRLSLILETRLADSPMQKVLADIEYPLVPILYCMEKSGIMLDVGRLTESSAELLKEAQSLEKEICEAAGYDFNVGSPKQLGQVLFDRLKLPVIRKTKTGYSTDSDVLDALVAHHPIAEKILEWREITKLRSTYVDALPRLVDPKTDRVHTSYNQALTTTGRLSSNNPNLQNIPIRSERGQKIRESFIAPQGCVLISADYSQIELRILAHITKDQALIKAFEEDLDIHTATASEVFGVKLDEVTLDHRRTAKAINFGIAYGMSDFGLAERLKVERKVATDFIERYFKRFPGVQRYMHEIVEQGKQKGYVETMFGRRRYYPELQSSNGRLRQMGERAAINMPIQGAAADIIKIAMIQVQEKLLSMKKTSAKMLLQVHDELVFEVQKTEADEIQLLIKEVMEHATKINVPLKVSIGQGLTWGSAH